MATLDGGGTPAREPRDVIEISDSEMDDSSEPAHPPTHDEAVQAGEDFLRVGDDGELPDTSACPWRTAQFHDQECSRYYDCPGHTLERYIGEEEQREDREHNHGEDDAAEEVHVAEAVDSSPPLPAVPGGEEDDRTPQAVNLGAAAPGTRENPISLDSPPVLASPELSRTSTPAAARNAGGDSGPSVGDHSSRSAGSSDLSPATSAPSQPSSSRSRPAEIVLPRWQSDSEVTYCPICHTQFSIFVRKHHCRKCGRVVCNSCSPHRITIPYQYIVQPPGYSSIPQRYPPLPGNEGYVDFNSLGGGERVRLCNPCVPDPNTAPPQTSDPSPRAHQPSSTNLLSPEAFPGANSGRYGPYSAPLGDPYARNRSVTMQSGASSSSQSSRGPYRGPPVFGGTPPASFPSGSSSSHPRNSHAPVPQSRYYQSHSRRSSSNAGPSSVVDRSLPPLPPPQPQIAEEDECPVCHRELPRRTLPNFEALREAHINICITAHSAYGSPRSAGLGNDEDDGAPLPRIPPRTTRMFPYVATEKDCVDSAECSICLEEFEVGVAMARLECLCRFHRHCITAWWERHPGRCPMHQHDSYGF